MKPYHFACIPSLLCEISYAVKATAQQSLPPRLRERERGPTQENCHPGLGPIGWPRPSFRVIPVHVCIFQSFWPKCVFWVPENSKVPVFHIHPKLGFRGPRKLENTRFVHITLISVNEYILGLASAHPTSISAGTRIQAQNGPKPNLKGVARFCFLQIAHL